MVSLNTLLKRKGVASCFQHGGIVVRFQHHKISALQGFHNSGRDNARIGGNTHTAASAVNGKAHRFHRVVGGIESFDL